MTEPQLAVRRRARVYMDFVRGSFSCFRVAIGLKTRAKCKRFSDPYIRIAEKRKQERVSLFAPTVSVARGYSRE